MTPMNREDTPHVDKTGTRIRLGDLVYLENWNEHLDPGDEIRRVHKKKFSAQASQFILREIDGNAYSDLDFINPQLARVISKTTHPEYFL